MISYTITTAERLEDGERGMSEHSCGLCGVDYDIDKNLSEGYQVTDNCECHTNHMEQTPRVI